MFSWYCFMLSPNAVLIVTKPDRFLSKLIQYVFSSDYEVQLKRCLFWQFFLVASVFVLLVTASFFLSLSLMLLMIMNDKEMKHHKQCSASLWLEGMPRHGDGDEFPNSLLRIRTRSVTNEIKLQLLSRRRPTSPTNIPGCLCVLLNL